MSSPEKASGTGSSGAEPSAPDAKPRVLIVDDEIYNLETFQRVFRKHFHIVTASSAKLALQELETHSFDVALIDYAMPGMNGAELLRSAVALHPSIAYFMMTAHADAQEVRDTLKAGLSCRIIMKPWSREEVLRWVINGHQLSLLRKSVQDMKRSV
ncbi:MAG: response regulator [Myxococcales bacterium]|jgi:response regulator RpfG family c-di-GMP phosphodiesterase|nr:response regulator [Myxococcales bacterium]